jgi:hypothetical protein
MQEKCRFSFEHVEIAAILAVFLRCPWFEWNSVKFFCTCRGSKHGRAIDGNGVERIGSKHFESREVVSASGGSGISGCGAGGNGTVQRDRAVRMQFLAVGGGWEIVLQALPQNHFDCALGAYTHNIPLSAEREKETEQTLQMMFDLGYVKPEEVAQIPRLAKTAVAIAYAPLGAATFEPDAVWFACKPAGAMLLNEAAGRARIGCGAPALGRPTCMALPATNIEERFLASPACADRLGMTVLA